VKAIRLTRLGIAAALCIVVPATALEGCSAPPRLTGTRWGGGGSTVSSIEDGVSTAYTVDHLTRNGRVYLVLAAGGCHGSTVNGGPPASGSLHAGRGREIEWSCATRDGARGTVTIDGQPFDLAKGAVFLVSTREKTQVEQLTVELSRLQGDDVRSRLVGLAETEPRVRAFLESCREEK
jgi:hypothetical protein